MVQNGKKHRINDRLIIHSPTRKLVSKVSEQVIERSKEREQSKWGGASERVSGASERCKRMSESTSKWPSTYIGILG